MKDYNEKVEELADIIYNLDEEDDAVLDSINEFIEDYYGGEPINRMSEMESEFDNMTKAELIELGANGFDIYDNYFSQGTNCNYYSFRTLWDCDDLDINDMARYCIDNDEDFGNADIREYLDENTEPEDE